MVSDHRRYSDQYCGPESDCTDAVDFVSGGSVLYLCWKPDEPDRYHAASDEIQPGGHAKDDRRHLSGIRTAVHSDGRCVGIGGGGCDHGGPYSGAEYDRKRISEGIFLCGSVPDESDYSHDSAVPGTDPVWVCGKCFHWPSVYCRSDPWNPDAVSYTHLRPQVRSRPLF